MKLFLLLILTLSSFTFAQFNQFPRENTGQLGGGLGLNWIDGKPHYTFHFNPEISFANFGAGLDLRLDVDSDGNLRKENFNETSDYLSIIRYLRYGIKNDPVFIKVGALDYYTLGHGSIMYMYNNSPSYDARKIGLVADIDFGKFGFESIYSKFAEAGVAGLRAYVRPLQFTDLAAVPIIGNFEIGFTYAGDFDENAGVTIGNFNPITKKLEVSQDKGSINIVGFDIGLPILSTGLVDLDLYFDYAKILDFGSGAAAGIMAQFNGLGIVTASAKLERRFNGDKYIPGYFNSFYEIERFRLDTTSASLHDVTSKVGFLENATNIGNGFYGELGISILGILDIIGSYQRLDKHPDSGIMHLGTEIAPEDFSFIARAGYDKINIQDEKDLFTLDDRSYLFTELGYKPYPYIIVSLVYSWMFTPVRDNDDNIISYETQKRIEPRISFVYPFELGK